MGKLTRRMMLKNAALPIAGTFALPILAKAVRQSSTPFQRPKLKIHRRANGTSPTACCKRTCAFTAIRVSTGKANPRMPL